MSKLTIAKALARAKSNADAGEFKKAKVLYEAILQAFPNNTKAQRGLAALSDKLQSGIHSRPPQPVVDNIMSLYKQGELKTVVEQSKDLTVQYPQAIAIWNIFGASAARLGKLDQAFQAFEHIVTLDPNQASAHFNMGNVLKDQGKINEAIKAYKKALSIKPDYEEALNNVVLAQKSLSRSGDEGASEVLETYNQALALKTETAASHFGRAIALQKKGKWDDAIDYYSKVLAIEPDYAEAYNNMAAALASQGKLDEAVEIYKRALATKPDYAEAYNNMAAALASQGKLDEAVEIYKRALATKPDYAEAYSNMAIALANQGKLQEAVETYKRALAIMPDYADAYNNMGTVLRDQGKVEDAIVAYKRALAINPDHADAFNNMGIIFADQGKLNDAIDVYSKALAINPDHADAYSNMATALASQGKLEEAIDAYSKALTINPDYAEVHYNLGNALRKQDRLDETIEAYSKALAINPDYADACYNLGNVLKDQGRLDDAIEAYNRALTIRPDYAEAYSNLGNVLKDQGSLEEAMEVYNSALAINPDYAEAYSNLGNVLKDLGKTEEAIEVYNSALTINPDYAEAYSNLGNALKDQGKTEEAIEAYNRALTIRPDYAQAHHNLSISLLNDGRLKEGLDEYEWRWKVTKIAINKRKFSKPLWDGEKSLTGKTILLWSEQGVGDTINWVSKLPFISSQAGHCILECPEKLVPLLTRSFPYIDVRPEDKRNDEQRNDFDYHLPLGSLYRHCLKEVLNYTDPGAFLLPDPARIKFWMKRLKSLGQAPYVGVSWKSAKMSPDRLPNYASINDWAPIFTIPDVTFINLQYVDFAHDLDEIHNKFGVTVHNFDDLDHYNDLDDVAALCAALDVVVSTKITVPLVSAGVGTLTKLANWKQSSWSNMLTNPVGPLVDTFEKNTWESWRPLFHKIAYEIEDLKTETCLNR